MTYFSPIPMHSLSRKVHLLSTVNERRASTGNKDVHCESEPERDKQVVVWAAQSVDGKTRKSWTCMHTVIIDT